MELVLWFKDLILEWSRDPVALESARRRLAGLKRDGRAVVSGEGRQQLVDYFALAIMLNSLSDLQTDHMAAIRRWVGEHDQGWATLFYTVGILLSGDKESPWPSIGAGLLMAGHSAKDKVKALYDQYSSRR